MIKASSRDQGKRLLIINFVTDESDPVLGFAVDWISELARHVDHLAVLTGRRGSGNLPTNVSVVSTKWKEGQNFRNLIRYYFHLIKVLYSFRPNRTFTHMAALQGLLAAPALKFLGIRHTMWYTHFRPTLTTRLLNPWLDNIATADLTTYPHRNKKVHAIGHGISNVGRPFVAEEAAELGFVHWGRCDPSKRLSHIAEVVNNLNCATGTRYKVRVIGSPSGEAAEKGWGRLLQADSQREFPVIDWIGAVKRSTIVDHLPPRPVFLHASTSGLDKAPLEAALMGVPVLSDNSSVFQALNCQKTFETLQEQVAKFVRMTLQEQKNFSNGQRNCVEKHHSLDSQAESLFELLFGGQD